MAVLGIDIGTGTSKAVLVSGEGRILRQAQLAHQTSNPRYGWYEQDAEAVWWHDVVHLCQQLLRDGGIRVDAVCVSGIGPAICVTGSDNQPLRPAILYGIDTRSKQQVDEQISRIGRDCLIEHNGNLLSTQSVGPKLQWIADTEPEIWDRTRRVYSAPGWIVWKLCGEYVLDRYSASASDPLYDLPRRDYWDEAWTPYAQIERPRLAWPSQIVGAVSRAAASETGMLPGTPVLAGTVDALSESYGAGCRSVGDTMVMYGSTMFMLQATSTMRSSAVLWATEGRTADTFGLSGGMATGGLITSWLANALQMTFAELEDAASRVAPGCDGLILLPYFSGERTPILDPEARGAWIGLTLAHRPGHLYRSALEGIAMGVRHNLDTMSAAGATARRLVAVGGGTAQRVWVQLVSDVLGHSQVLPSITMGACYGDARLAADALGIETNAWNPPIESVAPDESRHQAYDRLYSLYLDTYPAVADLSHRLARLASGSDTAGGPPGAGSPARRPGHTCNFQRDADGPRTHPASAS